MNGDMKNKKSPLLILLFAAVMYIVAVAGYLIERPDSDPDHLFFANTGGDVVMKHKDHANDLHCADCHHDLLSSDNRTACFECHEDDVDPEDFEHAELLDIEDHRCTTCHNRLHDDDPVSCRTCHLQEVKGTSSTAGCAECHDEDITPDFLTHDEMLEVEDHSCYDCHSVMALSDAFHQQCTDCHLKSGQARFVNDKGVARCVICHLK